MSRPLPNRSLLDEGLLPIAELARIAMREGVRPRAAYQAHKWFARRLAITARALLVSAAADSQSSFWHSFYRGNAWRDRTVLDPFVGGGVMLLEASRLGATVRGVDIEPVAAAIARFQTTLRKLPDLSVTLKNLVDSVGSKLAPFYEAQDEHGRMETLLHAFWVQVVTCGDCAYTYDAHPTFRFAWDEGSALQWVACSHCSRVLRAKISAKVVRCPCGVKTNARGGRVQRGEAACPRCNNKEKLIEYARRATDAPLFRLFAVETLPTGDKRRVPTQARVLRSATAFDRDRYGAAETRLREILARFPNALPKGPIPDEGRSDNRLVDYGYKDYADMFNARQKLHLALLGRAIAKLRGGQRDPFAIAFSDHLTTNNMLCAYAGGWRRLTPLFSIRAYRHITRPVEINPWLKNNGRGTFPNAIRAVVRASTALKIPVEPTPRGLLKLVKDAPPSSAEVICGDARRMDHIQSRSVDLVLTDPPYFDYISYSELGHFFTPWLARFGLIRRRHINSFPKGQLASTTRSVEGERRFARRLGSAFKEIRRVCKPQGRVVFTYQNLDGRGWNAIAQAMAKAGIIPIRALPLYGDSSASLHKQVHSISWDAVMICKLGTPMSRLIVSEEAQKTGAREALKWSKTLSAKKLPVTEGDRDNMSHAASIVAAFTLQTEGSVYMSSLRQKRLRLA
jgi:putative DNA methylase